MAAGRVEVCHYIAMALQPRRTIAAALFAIVFMLACEGESPLAPVPQGEGIVIYRDINFQGLAQAFNTDQKDLEDLDGACGGGDDGDGNTTIATWGDCISSVRVNPGWTATFYVDDSWQGRSFTASQDMPNLNTIPGPCRGGGFNDCISSIRISKVQ